MTSIEGGPEASAPARLAAARWFTGKDRRVVATRLRDLAPVPPAGATPGGVLALLEVDFADGPPEVYTLPLGPSSVGLDPARLIDAPAEPEPWLGLVRAVADERSIAGTAGTFVTGSGPLLTAARGRPVTLPLERVRPVGVDQSNTTMVVDEAVALKLYRRLEGTNPDLELSAYLGTAPSSPVPMFGGAIDYVPHDGGRRHSVALVQAYVAGAPDEYETVAEQFATWLARSDPAPPPPIRFADRAGRATARLHGLLAAASGPALEPRTATAQDGALWLAEAHAQVDRAIAAVATLDREGAGILAASRPRILEALAPLATNARGQLLTRIHGDFHLGQLLRVGRDYLFVDFEGEPIRSVEERRGVASPLRDVASFLRSIDHASHSAVRRVKRRVARPRTETLVEDAAELSRAARSAFLAAYAADLAVGTPIRLDPTLLRAFEVDKECYEFVYAATMLTEWLWAPTAGMRGLLAEAP